MAVAEPARPQSAAAPSPFTPIADYAFLSDCHSGALVAPDGTIDWLCVPRYDAPSVFGSLLDRQAGGFRLGPYGFNVPAARRYEPGTNVLVTTWNVPGGWVEVRDALTVGPRRGPDTITPHTRPPADDDAGHRAGADGHLPRLPAGLLPPRAARGRGADHPGGAARRVPGLSAWRSRPGPTARRPAGSPTARACSRCRSWSAGSWPPPSLAVAAWVLPGIALDTTGAAFAGAAAIAVLNAVLPPILAALRLPFMVAIGFLLVLFADAWLLMLAADLLPHDIRVDSFGDAFLAALLMAAVSLSLQVVLGTDDDSEYAMRVTRRVARRQGEQVRTDVPGIIYLEIDGLALPVLRDAMRDGNAPTMARWIAEGGYRLIEWETDLSSQTGASQAGILLGSNHDIPAFRWVEKATRAGDRVLVARRTAPRSSAASPAASGCSPTAARAAATCSPARPTRRSSPSAAPRPRSRPTPATARSWPTASTSRARSCCSCGRSCSR